MKRSLCLLALGLLSTAMPLAAQDAEARIEAARSRISSQGYPTALLDERIAEGRAKGIPIERIAAVAERRADAIQDAGNALRPLGAMPTRAELAAGADAVEAGIPANVLGRVARRARATDRAVAMAVLTFLYVEEGVPVETALARVTAALNEGPQALRDLPVRAAAARRISGAGAAGTRPGVGVGRRTGVVRPGEASPPVARPDRGNGNGSRP